MTDDSKYGQPIEGIKVNGRPIEPPKLDNLDAEGATMPASDEGGKG